MKFQTCSRKYSCRQNEKAFRERTGAFRKLTKKLAELGEMHTQAQTQACAHSHTHTYTHTHARTHQVTHTVCMCVCTCVCVCVCACVVLPYCVSLSVTCARPGREHFHTPECMGLAFGISLEEIYHETHQLQSQSVTTQRRFCCSVHLGSEPGPAPGGRWGGRRRPR